MRKRILFSVFSVWLAVGLDVVVFLLDVTHDANNKANETEKTLNNILFLISLLLF